MSSQPMRGLTVFISDIRNCRAKEQEEKRINKEMANIRSKFKDGNLSGYHKKKYVCKLLYMYILGYDIEFGHMEAVNLLSSTKYSEKYIGYLAVTLLLTENSDLARLVINSIRKDLEDYNEVHNCLALHAIANIGGREMAETLANDVYKLLISSGSKGWVKKKAALTLLRLFRKHPDIIPVQDWAERVMNIIDDADIGTAMAVTTLILALAQAQPELFSACVGKATNKMHKLVVEKDFSPDYLYYKVPIPWLQVKLLRLLQYYPAASDTTIRTRLENIIRTILNSAEEVPKNQNHGNAQNAVLFEAIGLAIHLDPDSELCSQAAILLGKFISSKETNIRYLGLEAMAHMAGFADSLESIKTHQETIIESLKDKDISVRRRALDLLYSMCDSTNARRIVSELLQYLQVADFAIKEEIVLKIAILAEKFAEDYKWYLDVILQLIAVAGDYVSGEVWYRVIQIVTNNENLQEYAAKTALVALKMPTCHETTLKVGGYILGEYGHLIANQPGCAPIDQYWALQSKFPMCSLPTRALLLTSYIKFVNLFPEIKGEMLKVFQQYRGVLDTELQQRACEYFALCNMSTDDLLQSVCEEMPPFPEKENALLTRLKSKDQDTEDKRTWNIGGKDANEEKRAAPKQKRERHEAPRTTVPEASAPQSSKTGGELDLLGFDVGIGSTPAPLISNTSASSSILSFTSSKVFYNKLLLGLSGLLSEDATLQVGLKMEYHANTGRISVFYGNKTQSTLSDFNANITVLSGGKVTLIQPMASTIGPFTQLNQMYSVENLLVIAEPIMTISFSVNNVPVSHKLKLPIVSTKYVAPIELSGTDFFAKWKQIGGPPREKQIVFKSTTPINMQQTHAAITACNLKVLDGVDPNANNYVGAGIYSCTSLGKVGCLLRLEPNLEQQMFRLTVRTTNESVTETITGLVEHFLKM